MAICNIPSRGCYKTHAHFMYARWHSARNTSFRSDVARAQFARVRSGRYPISSSSREVSAASKEIQKETRLYSVRERQESCRTVTSRKIVVFDSRSQKVKNWSVRGAQAVCLGSSWRRPFAGPSPPARACARCRATSWSSGRRRRLCRRARPPRSSTWR